jgi:hypothetical protein
MKRQPSWKSFGRYRQPSGKYFLKVSYGISKPLKNFSIDATLLEFPPIVLATYETKHLYIFQNIANTLWSCACSYLIPCEAITNGYYWITSRDIFKRVALLINKETKLTFPLTKFRFKIQFKTNKIVLLKVLLLTRCDQKQMRRDEVTLTGTILKTPLLQANVHKRPKTIIRLLHIIIKMPLTRPIAITRPTTQITKPVFITRLMSKISPMPLIRQTPIFRLNTFRQPKTLSIIRPMSLIIPMPTIRPMHTIKPILHLVQCP